MEGWLQPDPGHPAWRVAVTDKEDGNLSFRYGDEHDVRSARRAVLQKLGVNKEEVVSMSLDVSFGVHWFDSFPADRDILRHDGVPSEGFWIPSSGGTIFLLAADCFPVVLYDPVQKRLGMFHAGRAELLAGLFENFLRLGDDHQIQFGETRVYLGPGICTKHYVFRNIPDKFLTNGSRRYLHRSEGLYQVDLRSAIQDTLTGCGVQPKHVTVDGRCTFEDPDLFSHRQTNGKHEARFATLSRIKFENS